MNRKILFNALWLLTVGCVSVQSQTDRQQAVLTAALNSNDAYELELSYHYLFLPCVGIGGGVGYSKQWYNDYIPDGYMANDSRTSWRMDDECRKVEKLYIRPSILLKTPPLIKMGKGRIGLQIEPGLQLTIPYTGVWIEYERYGDRFDYESKSKHISSNKGDWCFWHLKSSMNWTVNKVFIGLGYSISNMDIYSTRRTMTVENTPFSTFYPGKRLTHVFFISSGYSF